MANKDQLLEQARELGITDVDESTKNEDIERRIADARAQQDDGSADAERGADEDADERLDNRDRAAASGTLEHSAGGATDRDGHNNVGVPVVQGHPSEPVGPEDAFGEGPKRGDYSDRDNDGSVHVQVTPDGPVHQNPNAQERPEDAPGLKGGVETDPAHPATEAIRRYAAAGGGQE